LAINGKGIQLGGDQESSQKWGTTEKNPERNRNQDRPDQIGAKEARKKKKQKKVSTSAIRTRLNVKIKREWSEDYLRHNLIAKKIGVPGCKGIVYSGKAATRKK